MATFIELPDDILIRYDSILSLNFIAAHEDTDEDGTPEQPFPVPARLVIATSELVETSSKYIVDGGAVVSKRYTVRGVSAERLYVSFLNNEGVTSRFRG